MRSERSISPPLLIGIASIPAQAVLLRELLARGAGNELSLTLYLSIWLAASATGALLWRRVASGPRWFLPLLAAGFAAACAGVVAARLIPLHGAVSGESPGPAGVLALGCAALALPAFLTAGLFPIAARTTADPGRAFVWEAIGAVSGGCLTTLLFLARFPAFGILGCVAILLCLGLGRSRGLPGAAFVAGLLLIGIPQRWDSRLYRASWERHHPGLAIRAHAATPTRVLTLAEREGERWLFSDGAPREGLDDPYRDEAVAALILASTRSIRSVLLVDFGQATVAPALLRAGVSHVAVLLPEREDTSLAGSHPGIQYRIGDPRRALRGMTESWDVIALAGGEAITVASNRLWTEEAFREMAARLNPRGVVLAIAPGGEAGAGQEARAWRAAVHAALREALGTVAAIDVDRFVFAASRRPSAAILDPDSLAARYRAQGWELRAYPPDRFAIEYPRERLRSFAATEPNADDRPAAVAHALLRWLRRSGMSAAPAHLPLILLAGTAVLLLFVPAITRGRGEPAGTGLLFAAGAAGLGRDLRVLIAYQARVGTLHVGLGVLLGSFLGGTALGAAWAGRLRPASPRRLLVIAGMAQAAAALAAALLLPRIAGGPVCGATALFCILAAGLGAVCALPFPLVARRMSAGSAWAADSAGGILGAALFLLTIGSGFAAAGVALGALPLAAALGLLIRRA